MDDCVGALDAEHQPKINVAVSNNWFSFGEQTFANMNEDYKNTATLVMKNKGMNIGFQFSSGEVVLTINSVVPPNTAYIEFARFPFSNIDSIDIVGVNVSQVIDSPKKYEAKMFKIIWKYQVESQVINEKCTKKNPTVNTSKTKSHFLFQKDDWSLFTAKEWRWIGTSNDKGEQGMMTLFVGDIAIDEFPCSLRKRDIISFTEIVVLPRDKLATFGEFISSTDTTKTNLRPATAAGDGEQRKEFPIINDTIKVLHFVKSIQKLEYIWLSMNEQERRMGNIFTQCHGCKEEVYFSVDGIRLRKGEYNPLHMRCEHCSDQEEENEEKKGGDDDDDAC